MTNYLWIVAALLSTTFLGACAPQGCSTSTDPATCANTEGVNNYNRQRQLNNGRSSAYPPGSTTSRY
jgi:hypothetical protein